MRACLRTRISGHDLCAHMFVCAGMSAYVSDLGLFFTISMTFLNLKDD